MSIFPVDTISILGVIKISSNCALVYSHICIEGTALGIFFFTEKNRSYNCRI